MGAGVLPRFENNWTRIFEIHFYYYCCCCGSLRCCFLSKERPTCHACFQRKERGFLFHKRCGMATSPIIITIITFSLVFFFLVWKVLPYSPFVICPNTHTTLTSGLVIQICFVLHFHLSFPSTDWWNIYITKKQMTLPVVVFDEDEVDTQPMFTTSPYRKRHQHCCSCYIYMSIYSIGVHFLGIITWTFEKLHQQRKNEKSKLKGQKQKIVKHTKSYLAHIAMNMKNYETGARVWTVVASKNLEG